MYTREPIHKEYMIYYLYEKLKYNLFHTSIIIIQY